MCGKLAAIIVSLLAFAPAAQAATTLELGTFDPGEAVFVTGSANAGPGKYRFSLDLSSPVAAFAGDVTKLTITDYFCDFGDGAGVIPCGGNDVPTLYDFLPVSPTRYEANVTVNPFISVPLTGGEAVRYDEFDDCCTYSFGFDGIADGSYTLSFTPVPEPASWMLMIVGVGVVGAAMRRRIPALT